MMPGSPGPQIDSPGLVNTFQSPKRKQYLNLPQDRLHTPPIENEILNEIGLVANELQGKIMAVGPSYSKLVSNRTVTARESPEQDQQKFVPYKMANRSQSSSASSRAGQGKTRNKLQKLIKIQKQPLN